MFHIIEYYYNEKHLNVLWKAFDCMTDKADQHKPKGFIGKIYNSFLHLISGLYAWICFILPQGITYPCYWVAILLYRYRVEVDVTLEKEYKEEQKQWCKEHNIKSFWFCDWLNMNILMFSSRTSYPLSVQVGFKTESDLMAFKLRWME